MEEVVTRPTWRTLGKVEVEELELATFIYNLIILLGNNTYTNHKYIMSYYTLCLASKLVNFLFIKDTNPFWIILLLWLQRRKSWGFTNPGDLNKCEDRFQIKLDNHVEISESDENIPAKIVQPTISIWYVYWIQWRTIGPTIWSTGKSLGNDNVEFVNKPLCTSYFYLYLFLE